MATAATGALAQRLRGRHNITGTSTTKSSRFALQRAPTPRAIPRIKALRGTGFREK
jgi:hypothetical protein